MIRGGRIAVCLLTADRHKLTWATVESFLKHNPTAHQDFLLLHADDGSSDRDALFDFLRARNFMTVARHDTRAGQMPLLQTMWGHAAALGANRVLHLENDQEWVAPVPQDVVAPCVRLYGEMKARSGPRAPAGEHLMGTKDKITWERFGTRWERAREAHWGHSPPSRQSGRFSRSP